MSNLNLIIFYSLLLLSLVTVSCANVSNQEEMSSISPKEGSAKLMYSQNPVETGTINSTVLYKIDVPSLYTLSLRGISLSLKAFGNAYVTIDALSDFSSSVYVISSNDHHSLKVINYNKYSKTIYVSVRPASIEFPTSVEFVPYIDDSNQQSVKIGTAVAFSVFYLLCTVVSIIVVVVTIKRNRKGSPTDFHPEI